MSDKEELVIATEVPFVDHLASLADGKYGDEPVVWEAVDGYVGHVLRVPTHEIRREPAGEKWCFHCRERLPHEIVVHAPENPSYYGPHWTYACSGCDLDRVDFPGTWTERGWEGEE